MKKIFTLVVLLGLLLSLQVPLVGAQDEGDQQPIVEEQQDACELNEDGNYVVQEGDTAEGIAEKCGVPSVDDLLAANELGSADEIEVGDELVIPAPADEPVEEPEGTEGEQPEESEGEQPEGTEGEQPEESEGEQPEESEGEQPEETEGEQPEETEGEQPEETEGEQPEETEGEQPEETVVEEPADQEPPVERAEESTVEEEPAVASDEVESVAQHPGSYTTQIVAIANLLPSGDPETAAMTLYNIDGGGETPVGTMPPVYPGGVGFVDSSQFTTGRYAAVIESAFPAAAVAFTVNNTAKTADAYTGFDTPELTLYGTLIFNKHANFESSLYCQNAGTSPTTIEAALYKTGEGLKVTLSATVEANNAVAWDIADDATVQTAWPGGTGEFGYAVFSSSPNPIACVVDNQRMASPYVQSQFNGAPSTYAGMDLRVPLVFNGHGGSSSNSRGVKWNTGISLVNINSTPVDVSVTYTSGSYTNTCSKQIAGNGSDAWYAPEVGTPISGWTCTGGPLDWSYPGGPTFGSAQISSSANILAIANSNRYDSTEGLGAGYSSLGAAPSVATAKSVCPLAFNKDPGTNWVTGIQATNIGSETVDIAFTMVRANANPAGLGNSAPITVPGIAPGSSATVYFPESPGALTDFDGAVFVEASSASGKIAVSSSNTSYSAAGAAALYDCVNY